MKNVNIFQIAKVQPQSALSICLIFCHFLPAVADKSVAYSKMPVFKIMKQKQYFPNIFSWNTDITIDMIPKYHSIMHQVYVNITLEPLEPLPLEPFINDEAYSQK